LSKKSKKLSSFSANNGHPNVATRQLEDDKAQSFPKKSEAATKVSTK
jgi:hypothetical protein